MASETELKHGLYYYAIQLTLMGGMLHIGHMLAFSGLLLPQLMQERALSHSEQGLIVIIYLITAFEASSSTLGTVSMALFSSWLSHRLGRKKAILSLLMLATMGFVLPLVSKGNTAVLVVARVMQGMGVLSMVHSVYVAETSSPIMRGWVSGLANMAINLGVLNVYFIGAFVHWQILSAILAFFPAISLILFLTFGAETPKWLQMRGRIDEAERIRQSLGLNTFSETPRMDLEEAVGLCEKLIDPVFYKPVLIIIGVMALTMLSGGFVLSFFALQFFQKINENVNPDLPAIITSGIRLLGSFGGIFVLGKFNRRTTMIASGLGMALTILPLAFTLYFESALISALPQFQLVIQSYWPILLMSLFTLVFSAGMGVVPFVLLGELALPENAALTSGLGLGVGFAVLFASIQLYPSLVSMFGIWAICLFFGAICLFSSIFVYLFLPETHNKSVQEVAKSFQNDNSDEGQNKELTEKKENA